MNAYIYTDRYFAFDYGITHPLKIERLKLTFELSRAYGLFNGSDISLIETVEAKEDELLIFHTRDYLEVLKQASSGRLRHSYSYGIGPGDNPAFPGLWEWSLLHTGASIRCAELVLGGGVQIAFNIAGGLHHAMPDRASGFCYINDPVICILKLLKEADRVLYLDIDAHHGDGVQWAFYEEPRVLTISFHQDGRTLFPGTGSVEEMGRGRGRGYAINIPMLPGTDNRVFLKGFHEIVPELFERFRPDVVVTQLGVDSFRDDPLAGLCLGTEGFLEVIRFLKRNTNYWIALGGGGYNSWNVARAWTLAWATMIGVELSDEIPEEICSKLDKMGIRERELKDKEEINTSKDAHIRYIERVISYIEKEIIPLI